MLLTFPKYAVRFVVFVIIFLSGAKAFAQNEERIQILKKEAADLTGIDKVRKMVKIGYAYISSGTYLPDSALHYGEEAFHLAQSIDDKEAICGAANLSGNVSLQLSLIYKGLYYYRIVQQLGKELGDINFEMVGARGVATALWYHGKFGQAIDTLQIVMNFFRDNGRRVPLADATMILSSIYADRGDYEKAFETAQEALKLSEASGDGANIVLSIVQLGYLYRLIGDYPTAMNYFKRGFEYHPFRGGWAYRHLCNRTGDLYCDLKKYDSAYYFYRQSIASHSDSKTSLLRMADYYLLIEKPDTAAQYYERVYRELKDGGEGNLVIFALLGLGKTSLVRKESDRALDFGRKAMSYALQRDSRVTLRDVYQLLSEAHEALDNADSAFLYFRKYMEEKDIVMSDQFKGRLFAFKHSSRIQMLEQEKLMSEQKLRANKMVRNILIGGIVLLILLGWILVWNISLKRKNEKLTHERAESEWKRRAGELEMQALRAQMNPHFIFNALSSVNRFILKNDPDKASDYLTRFSRLIRLVLVNSQRDLIQLEEEIEMLQLYLQIEQLRFKNAFEYEIVLADDIDASVIFVPPLLLQPFCENAIWHGLMHQTTPGKLRVEFSMKGDVVHCTITDNGIGIKKAQELASTSPEKIKSLGLRLTRDRLALFNQGNAMHTSYEIEDIVHEDGSVQGTRVKLQIRHQSVYNPVKTAPV